MKHFQPAFSKRLIIAKFTGFLLGVGGALFLPLMIPEIAWQTQLGMVMWYALLGGIIGVTGVMRYHPTFGFSIPYWARGVGLGLGCNIIIAFLAYPYWESVFVSAGLIPSIFQPEYFVAWMALEGAVAGFIIDFAATKYAGEGEGLLKK